MKTKLCVLFGGKSSEHEVSCMSAYNVLKNLDKEKYEIIKFGITKTGATWLYTGDDESIKDGTWETHDCTACVISHCPKTEGLIKLLPDGTFEKIKVDVFFPVLHGKNGEDGTIQGFFEFLRLPYVGCDIISSAVGMDKAVFKDVLAAAGLPVLPCVRFYSKEYFHKKEEILKKIETEIGLPVIVKPANLGSSVGISKASTKEELLTAIDLSCSFADKILVERAVTGIREINCSVLGDYDDCEASVCEEPIMHDDILSFEDKYLGGGKAKGGSKGMTSLSRKLPAEITEEKAEEIRTLSKNIFKALGGCGIARIDYILDTEDNDRVYANEINTIPGSLAFYLWEASGIKYADLLDRAVALAFKRKRTRDALNFTFESNILSGVHDLSGAKGSKGSKC